MSVSVEGEEAELASVTVVCPTEEEDLGGPEADVLGGTDEGASGGTWDGTLRSSLPI